MKKDNGWFRAALILLLLPALAIAFYFIVPAFLLAVTGPDGGPAEFTNKLPYPATSDQYAVVKVNFSDPDGISLASPAMYFDGSNVTRKCSVTDKSISYSHSGIKLSEGSHHVEVRIADTKGYTYTTAWDFIVEKTAPVISPPNACGQIIESSTPTISYTYSDPGAYDNPPTGSGIDPANTVLKLDDVPVAAAIDEYGATYTPLPPLAEGKHTTQLIVKDKAGNQSTHSCSFLVDSQTPVISNLQPENNSSIDSDNPLIKAGWSDAGAGIDVYSGQMLLDGIDVSAAATKKPDGISFPAHGLSLGTHNVTVKVKDLSGHTSEVQWHFTIADQQAPTITTPAVCGLVTGNPQPTLSYQYSDNISGIDTSSVILALDGTAVPAAVDQYGATYTPLQSLADGLHVVQLSVSDKAGNQSTHNCSFTVDTVPPAIGTDVEPADGSQISIDHPLIRVSWSDAGAGIDVYSGQMLLDGIDVSAQASRDQQGISYQAQGLGRGMHTVAVTVRDQAGKAATRQWSFNVADWQPPTINSPALCGEIMTSATPVISYSYLDPSGIDVSSVVMKIDNATVAAYADQYGVSYTPPAPLSEGQHLLELTVNDMAGNQAHHNCSFSVDTSSPIISNLRPAPNATSGTDQPLPIIAADWSDSGSGVDQYSARMMVDKTDVTSEAVISEYGISYQPQALTLGYHTVMLSVKDKVGKSSELKIWSFWLRDKVAPVVNSPAICGGATEETMPELNFTYYDPGVNDDPPSGVGINEKSVVFKIDNTVIVDRGVVVDSAAKAAYADQYGVSYTPPAPLAEGWHKATLIVMDLSSNRTERSCDFAIDNTAPVIDSVEPAAGAIVGPESPLIKVNWHDVGAGIDVYSAHLELDGTDVTSHAAITQYDMTYQTEKLTVGQHTVRASVKDLAGKAAVSKTWTFDYANPISYFAPWYDSVSPGMQGNWILISNQADTSATVDVYIGESWQRNPDDKDGHYRIAAHDKVTPQLPGTIGGPLKVISRHGEELLVSQRVLYKDSFNEVMAVRESDLDTAYRFTWYDYQSAGMNGNWILVGNPGSQNATVDVYVGKNLRFRYDIPAGGKVAPIYPGVMDGPIEVNCINGQKIIASQRVLYNGSFSEVMGVPVSQLDKEYYFTWYDSRPAYGMNGNWILVSNESASQDAYVEIYIGPEKMASADQYGASGDQYGGASGDGASGDQYSGQWKVPAGSRITPIFWNKVGGPVRVVCTNCTSGHNILASQRVIYKSSFEEVQGTSPRDMGSSAVFPWYDFQSAGMNGNWILIGNTNAAKDAYMQVFIDSSSSPLKMNDASGPIDTFVAAAGGGSTTPIFPGIMGGPVKVNCTSCVPGQKLIISQRVIYKNSFNEVVGRPPRT